MNIAEVIARSRPDWMRAADRGCVDRTPAEMMASRLPRWAKVMCGDCPHVQPCADYALDHPELDGVWGGTTARMRREIRRAQAVAS